jgi:hypothetical protein
VAQAGLKLCVDHQAMNDLTVFSSQDDSCTQKSNTSDDALDWSIHCIKV